MNENTKINLTDTFVNPKRLLEEKITLLDQRIREMEFMLYGYGAVLDQFGRVSSSSKMTITRSPMNRIVSGGYSDSVITSIVYDGSPPTTHNFVWKKDAFGNTILDKVTDNSGVDVTSQYLI